MHGLTTMMEFHRSLTNFNERSCDISAAKEANQLAVDLWQLEAAVDALRPLADKYDSRTGQTGNGYRSIIKIAGILRFRCIEVLDKAGDLDADTIRSWRDAVLTYTKIVRFGAKVQQFAGCRLYGEVDEVDHNTTTFKELCKELMDLDVSPLYGEAIAFNYEDNLRTMLYSLSVSYAALGDVLGGSLANKLKRLQTSGFCWDYVKDSSMLGKQIVAASREKQVNFVKCFFNVTETRLMSRLRMLPSISTSHLHRLEYTRLTASRARGTDLEVPIPSSHNRQNYVNVRLVSSFRSVGMLGTCNCIFFCRCTISDPSPFLLFHIHGGGFVSQTSQSHEDYLRQWAVKLGVPILSVDYSLAPEAPYPRALEEVLYCYCWALREGRQLGTTAQHIIVAGDSAGGNLAAGLTLKCLELGLQKPTAAVLSYAALMIQFVPTPSRLLTLIDPLLMFGNLLRCMNAYADPSYLSSLPRTLGEELHKAPVTKDVYLSPLLASREQLRGFPATLLVSSDNDPCLDECVEFSNNLLDAGVRVDLEVMSGLPHGFLSFAPLSARCQRGLDKVTNLLLGIIHRTRV